MAVPHDAPPLLPAAQTGIPRHVLMQYHKQLVTSRTVAFHQQTLRMMSQEQQTDPSVKRDLVIKRVARELWTNFCVRGEDTPMLRHLCQCIRAEFGQDLEFDYQPGGFELMVLRRSPEGLSPLNGTQKLEITNRAWVIAKEVVESCVI